MRFILFRLQSRRFPLQRHRNCGGGCPKNIVCDSCQMWIGVKAKHLVGSELRSVSQQTGSSSKPTHKQLGFNFNSILVRPGPSRTLVHSAYVRVYSLRVRVEDHACPLRFLWLRLVGFLSTVIKQLHNHTSCGIFRPGTRLNSLIHTFIKRSLVIFKQVKEVYRYPMCPYIV